MRRDTTIINPHQLYIELGVDELELSTAGNFTFL